MDKYEPVREIGAGNFGVTKLMRNKDTRELVAMKFIERGNRIDDYVFREIVNHRSLRHPNIIRFNEVVAIVMEYAAGGQLFERMCEAGRFLEDEARYFFQQLACGVSFCHAMNICHRHIKPENTLLDGSPAPRLKICNFQVVAAALPPQVNGGHAGVHRARGAVAARVRRQAGRRVVVRRHALRHARRGVPVRGSQGLKELPRDNLADHLGAVQDPRVRARLPGLPPPPLPHLRPRPGQEDHHEQDQEPPLVPQEPGPGVRGGGPGSLLQPPSSLQVAERAGDHEDRAGGADGAQAGEARLRLRPGRPRQRPLRGGGGGRGRASGNGKYSHGF